MAPRPAAQEWERKGERAANHKNAERMLKNVKDSTNHIRRSGCNWNTGKFPHVQMKATIVGQNLLFTRFFGIGFFCKLLLVEWHH